MVPLVSAYNKGLERTGEGITMDGDRRGVSEERLTGQLSRDEYYKEVREKPSGKLGADLTPPKL